MIRRLGVAALALLLAACAAPAPRPPLPFELPASWQAQGRLAVKAGAEAWHGTFAWHQEAEQLLVELAGPLGQGGLRLRESPSGALLETGSEAAVHGADTEALLAGRLGWTLPVRGLRYWITGRADPARPVTRRRDAPAGSVILEQDGWSVTCDRYLDVDGGRLPQRVVLERAELRVRLVVDRWQLGGAAGGER